jgi:hypothetical protein
MIPQYFIRDAAVGIFVGMVLLLLLSRPIGRVQFSLSTAFWCSFIGHILLGIISFVIGFFFSRQTDNGSMTNINGIAALVGLAIGCFLQAVLFQVFARTQNDTLARWRAVILSLIAILGDFLVASPLIEVWEHFRK